ncbi:MAG: hypothetical protein B7Z73_04220, partial [Planctomycetia bacterium 21-64-5]
MIRTLTIALFTTLAIGLNVSRAAESSAAGKGQKVRFYVGSYADAESEAIHLVELDRATGKLTKVSGTSGVQNPSFLAIHPNQRFLYSVCEVAEIDGQRSGAIAAFAIDPADGSLKALNRESSGGQGPCHLVVDKAGKNVLAANYGG